MGLVGKGEGERVDENVGQKNWVDVRSDGKEWGWEDDGVSDRLAMKDVV